MNNASALVIEIANLPLSISADPVDALKLLHNPTKGGLGGRLFALVKDGLVLGV